MLLPLFGFVLFLLAMTPLALAALRQLPPQNQGVTSYVAGYLIFIVGSGLGFFTTVIASNWLDRLLMIPPWLWLPLIFLGAWGGGILSVCIGEALRGGRRDTATAAKAAIICAALLVVYSHFRFLDSLQINNSNLSRGRLV